MDQHHNDNPFNPDCLDHTDERDDVRMSVLKDEGFSSCFQNPTFLCEESNPFDGFRGFVCGDGQQIKMSSLGKLLDPTEQKRCSNGRDKYCSVH